MTGKSLRLTFKGDKPKRKRSKKSSEERTRKRGTSFYNDESDAEMYGGDEQTWVPAEAVAEVCGPAFVHYRQGAGATVLSFNAPLTQVETSSVEAPSLPSDLTADGATIAEAEVTPQTIYQVWVVTKMPEMDQWTLKSAQGTFLGCDRYGEVLASNEARGPQEEWKLCRVEVDPSMATDDAVIGPRPGYAFKSYYGGWLAREDASSERKRLVRADATELTAACVWDISVQWKFRHEARHMRRSRGAPAMGTTVLDEERIALSRQGWNAGTRQHVSTDSRRELLEAQRAGRLNEAMLDRRVRLKSDKYA